MSLMPVVPEFADHEDEEESTPEPVMAEEEQNTDKEDLALSVTEPPVSQLSQKHMFWFPSEAFQEEEHHLISTEPPIKAPGDENHIATKTDDRQPEAEINTEEEIGGYITQPPTHKPVSHSANTTEESWLDGYPVPQEEEKAGAGSTDETEPGVDTSDRSNVEEFESVTDSAEEADLEEIITDHQRKGTEGDSETPEDQGFKKGTEEETEFVTKSPGGKDYGGVFHVHEEEYQGVPDTPQGNFSDGVTDLSEEITEVPKAEDMEGEAKRPEEVGSKDVTERSKHIFHSVADRANDVEMSPTTSTSLTQITAGRDDKRPMLYTPGSAPENVSTSQDGMGFERTSTPSGIAPRDTKTTQDTFVNSNVVTPTTSISWETKGFGHFLEQGPTRGGESHNDLNTVEGDTDRSLDHQEKAEEAACGDDPCQVSGRGPIIAAIIVGIVAAVVLVALGVWCYKRKQQKSSHYQLNGTNRQTQCIELQQTV